MENIYSEISDTESEGNLIIDESVNNSPGIQEAEEELKMEDDANLNNVANEVQVIDRTIEHQNHYQYQHCQGHYQVQYYYAPRVGAPAAHHPGEVICCSTMRPSGVIQDSPGLDYYFNNIELSDIKLIVIGFNGQQKVFKGHKFIFGLKSPIFKTEFQNNPYLCELTLTGIKPPTFEWFMNCVYETKQATKYFLPKVEGGMELTNLFLLYQLSYCFQTKEVADKCDEAIMHHILEAQYHINYILQLWEWLNEHLPGSGPLIFVEQYLGRYSPLFLNTTEYLKLNQAQLVRFIAPDTLIVGKELMLFYFALRWAKIRCQEQGIRADQENIRQQLGPALYKIRFPTMDYNDFREVANCKDCPLIAYEIWLIENWFDAIGKNPRLANAVYPPFITKPRSPFNTTPDFQSAPAPEPVQFVQPYDHIILSSAAEVINRNSIRATCIFYEYLVSVTEALTAPGREISFFAVEFLNKFTPLVHEYCAANHHHHFVTGSGFYI